MKKIFRNSIIILIVLLMIAGVLMPLFTFNPVKAEESVESLQAEIEKNKNQISEMESARANIEIDISKELLKLEDYRKEIKDLKIEIDALNQRIYQSEREISRLETVILERQKKIDEIELKVKQYMVNAQSSSRVNGFFEFVMGGSDFSEIVIRIEGMSAIKRYNEDLIREVNLEKEALEEDRRIQEEERKQIVLRKEIAEQNKSKAEATEKYIASVIQELHKKELELEAKIAEVNDKNAANASKIKQLSGGIVGSNGFTLPIASGNYRVTASVWNYPAQYGGSPHMGVDLGADTGTPVLAVGNGIILSTNTGCYPGNFACGWGYGNYISYLVQVNNHNYGIVFGHLSSVNVGQEQKVNAGDVIGYSGNTGSSSGPHLHVEVIDMGTGTIFDAWNRWKGDPQFGTGSASSGGRRCDAGHGVPCRLNPETTLGV